MKRYSPQQAIQVVTALAEGAGVPRPDAAILADALIDADLHGTGTHGISRLGIYLERIAKGLIDPKAALRTDRAQGSVLALDAGNGLGQVQAVRALDLLLPLARQNGVAAATVRRSQHFGALSYYTNRAAAQQCVLLAVTNCEPAMSPEGGYQPFFGTNPIAASFPTGQDWPVKIDLATSIVARGNIIAAKQRGEPIPEGWALDSGGNPTTSAEQALQGTVLTMAGHKGYALALLVEMLSGVLSGAAVGADVGSMYKDMDRPQGVGHFFCLLDIAAFQEPADFRARADQTVARLKGMRRRPGVEEILVPGERSARAAAANSIRGVTIAEPVLRDLEAWSSRLGVPIQLDEVRD